MKVVIVVATIVMALLVRGSMAAAQTSCFGSRVWNQDEINIKYTTDPIYGLQHLGIPTADLERLIRRSAAMFSEQSGTLKRLEYQGPIATGIEQQNSIVISSSDVWSDAPAEHTWVVVNGVMQISRIIYYRYNLSGQLRQWQFTEDLGANQLTPEFVSVLLHELGHAVGNLHHPGSAGCVDTGQWSIMHPFYGTLPVKHGLTHHDRYLLALKYSARSTTSNLSYRNWTGSAWQSMTALLYSVLYRPANLSQNFAWTVIAYHAGPPDQLAQYKRVYSSGSVMYPELVSATTRMPGSSVSIDNIGFGAIWAYPKVLRRDTKSAVKLLPNAGHAKHRL